MTDHGVPPRPIPADRATEAAQAEIDLGDAAERLARRPWPAIPLRAELEVSFEFFPPNSEEATDRLVGCAAELDRLGPSFASVTYGAGGSNRDRTLDTLDRLIAGTTLRLAGHLTTVAASKDETLAMVDRYRDRGVDHIVALRGDPPADQGTTAPETTGFASAAELVSGIREQVGDEVEISVAAYPEVHPKALSAAADLDRLKEKIDAGADRAITQFFYDNDTFLRFQDRCRAAGISIPIVAGIMPITSFKNISRFANRCGTNIPEWMPELFDGLDDAPEIHRLVAATVAAEQCRELAERGVRHFHFYTMNRPELTVATCRILGIRPTSSSTSVADNEVTANAC